MRIWLLTGEYPPQFGGGIATYCDHTARMLSARGHDVTVITADPDIQSKWEIEDQNTNLRVVRFSSGQDAASASLGQDARWSYDAAIVLSELLKKVDPPDVLESQEYLGLPYFFLIKRLLLDKQLADIPILLTAHTPLYICNHYDQFPSHLFSGYWIGEMERFCLKAAEGIVFPSHYLKKEIEVEMPEIEARSWVIPNPYQVKNTSSTHVDWKSRRGFLFTAKIERRKGIFPLLEEFNRLWELGVDEPLFLVGDDWYDPLNQQWVSEIIRNKFPAQLDRGLLQMMGKQPPEYLQEKLNKVRAVILPSLFENYPYAVLEAMTAGCLVIVSDSGGHAEIVEDRISGFVFSHDRKGDLGAKIRTVLALDQEQSIRIGEAARERVERLTSYEAVAPHKEQVLERVCERYQAKRLFPFQYGEARVFKTPQADTLRCKKGVLSVVIPFYNLGRYLEDALKSFDNYIDHPLDILVIDDGTDDDESLQILNELQNRYEFRLERVENAGLANARNTGAKLAYGEFIAFLDADDCMNPQFYTHAIEILEYYDNVSYVGCWAEYFGEINGIWPTWTPEPPYVLVHNTLSTSSLVIRRADFLHYGLNDPSFEFGMEDYDSLLSLIENGCRGVAIPVPYFKYRVRQGSMLRCMTHNINVVTYEWLVQKHKQLYREFASEVISLINTNGPGFLYDNPTLNWPVVGFLTDHGVDGLSNEKYSHLKLAELDLCSLLEKLSRPPLGNLLRLNRNFRTLLKRYLE